jgi:hypothetical protein
MQTKTEPKLSTESLERIIADSGDDSGVGKITLTRPQLKEWFEFGVINADTYIFLAINFARNQDDSEFNLNISNFCQDWEVETGEGKTKAIKPRQVRACLAKLEAAGAVSAPNVVQLSLLF